MQTSCLTSSALVGASTWWPEPSTTWRSYAEVAPELVNFAKADAVRVCRVAELVRVNHDAKKIREEELKTHCRLVATNNRRKKQKSPQGGKI